MVDQGPGFRDDQEGEDGPARIVSASPLKMNPGVTAKKAGGQTYMVYEGARDEAARIDQLRSMHAFSV